MTATITKTQFSRKPADSMSDFLRSVRQTPAGVPPRLWEEALVGPVAEFLNRPGKHFRGKLVTLAWELAEGNGEPPSGLPLVVELLHAGSLIVDDIQDGSVQRRGKAALHRLIGVPAALNVGNWLYFWPLTLFAETGLPAEIELRLHRLSSAAIRQCHEGQALDLSAKIGDLHPAEVRSVCRTISTWKTGSLMGLAAGLGATAAGGSDELTSAVMEFGESLGVALQMQNDLTELTGAAGPLKHPEDLAQGKVTWPWAWAANRMSASAFDAIQMRGAKLADGTGNAATLAAELLAALGSDPLKPVREELSTAYDRLAEAVGPRPALSAIRLETDRLLRKYT
jgi:geranylgeranyl pyrophosphate synthase